MSDKDRAVHFWCWFSANHHFFTEQLEATGWMDSYDVLEVLTHVEGFSNNLGFEITWDPVAHIARLFITAYGRKRYFKEVRLLLSHAPEVPGWEFIAFIQPRDIDYLFEKEFGRTGIKPAELKFEQCENFESRAGLDYTCVYTPEWEPADENFFYEAVKWIILNLLGEEVMATSLGVVVLLPMLADFKDDPRAPYIAALPTVIGQLPSKMKVRRNGALSIK